MTTSLILHAIATGEGKALPLVLEGYPKDVLGVPAHYFRKNVIVDGNWVHRGGRQPFEITPSRTSEWEKSHAKRLAAGIRTPILKRHTENPSADDTLGYLLSLSRNGEGVDVDMQLIGGDVVTIAARNDVSIYEKAEGVDAKGNPYGLHLDHIALTPQPNQPNLGPFVTIAASAGGSAVEVPIYHPATAKEQESPMLKPETLTALRTKLPGLKSGATDAEVAEAAAVLALNPPADPQVVALSASVSTLTTERDTARTELETAKTKVLSLSANAPATDPMVLSLMGDQFDARAEAAIEAGAPKSAVDYFAGLVRDNTGKPTALALSACSVPVGEGKVKSTNLGAAILDGLTKLYKGTFGTGTNPGIVAPANILALTAGDTTEKAPTPERMAELRQMAQLPTPAK